MSHYYGGEEKVTLVHYLDCQISPVWEDKDVET